MKLPFFPLTLTGLATALLLVFGGARRAGAVEATATTSASNSASPSKIADLLPDPVVARGKGFEIKRSRVDEALITIKANLAARGQAMSPSESLLLERQILERLIQIHLVLPRATDADRAKGKELAEKWLAELKSRAPSEEVFHRQLKSVALTEAVLRARRTEETIADVVVERELDIQISDEAVKKFYEENPARFEEPEMVRASHILLSTRDPLTGMELSEELKTAKRKQIEELLDRARKGEDFALLARTYSDDPGSKDKGGEYVFPRGRMVREFELAAFALGTNQISEVVTTQFGYHIIKLSEKIPARTVPFDTVSAEIRQFLKAQEMQKHLPAYLAKLKQEAAIEILDERLKAAPEAAAGARTVAPAGAGEKPAPPLDQPDRKP